MIHPAEFAAQHSKIARVKSFHRNKNKYFSLGSISEKGDCTLKLVITLSIDRGEFAI